MASYNEYGGTLEKSVDVHADCGIWEGKKPVEQNENLQEFLFYKRKMIGTVTYKRTNTTIIVSPTDLEINKEIKNMLGKTKTEHQRFSLSSIRSANMRTVLDFWDTLYAILFAILGFFLPISFAIAAVCLWCGYGKEIEILTTDGNKISIPFARSKADAEKLLTILAK